ncbi:hypothetical protein H2199_004624 [Coniosporium tulheliwenetii]|uniref:Uncharacterized protein n=1 Tax=Coniosporium tulheliwenetii TaxID=3383036 RepID=A0ACC2Z730_9PEZI|nr:hypothetical protein H2199_004624 [Cladosporium sp. JES 115]
MRESARVRRERNPEPDDVVVSVALENGSLAGVSDGPRGRIYATRHDGCDPVAEDGARGDILVAVESLVRQGDLQGFEFLGVGTEGSTGRSYLVRPIEAEEDRGGEGMVGEQVSRLEVKKVKEVVEAEVLIRAEMGQAVLAGAPDPRDMQDYEDDMARRDRAFRNMDRIMERLDALRSAGVGRPDRGGMGGGTDASRVVGGH